MKKTLDNVSEEDFLSAFFDASRDETPHLSERLSATILADAQAVQDERAKAKSRGLKSVLNSFFQMGSGGWAGAGGLVAMALLGTWIGFSSPNLYQPDTGASDEIVADIDGFESYLLDDFYFFDES